MEAQIQAAMAQIDHHAERKAREAAHSMGKRHDPENAAATMEAWRMMWRTEREVIETRVRDALQELTA